MTTEQGVISKIECDVALPSANGIALPGLPNLHSHTFQRGMAGLAETRGTGSDSFWTWRQVMYHFVDRLRAEEVEAIAAYAFMEMLERGFTSVAEFHYLHHDPTGAPYTDPAELSMRIIAAASAVGIGLTLLPVLYTYGGFGGKAAESGQKRFINSFDQFARLVDAARSHARHAPSTLVGLAPHSLRAVALRDLADLRSLAGGPIHIHVAEQLAEVEESLAWSNTRPVEALLKGQLLDERWCLVHATHMDAAEVSGVAASRAVVGLCPITEANLGDGIFSADAFLAAGGRFGVGSDSNVDIDAAGELRMFEYGQRLSHRARNVLAPTSGASTGRFLYERAVQGGTQALGLKSSGLQVGSRADIVVLGSDHPDLAYRNGDQWVDTYVFAGGSRLIELVIANGIAIVEHGRHRQHATLEKRYRDVLARIAYR